MPMDENIQSYAVKATVTPLQRFGPPGLVLIIGLVLSFGLFNELFHHNQAKLEENFRQASHERLAAVEKRISSELVVLRSIVGFYQGSDFVSSNEFHTFVSTVLTKQQSFQALEWIPRIPAEEREAFVDIIKRDGYDSFVIKEKNAEGKFIKAGDRAEYFPVYYVEPFKGNEGAHGFDLASNPVRLKALELARDSGEMIASSKISLVQLKENNAGILLFVPVFKKNTTQNSVDERRANLAGFSLGVIRVSSLISGLHTEEQGDGISKPAGIDLYVYEGDGKTDFSPLYTHSSRTRSDIAPELSFEEARQGPVVEQPFKIGGRVWMVIARPVRTDFGGGIPLQSWLVLIASLLLTTLAFAYVISAAKRTRIIEDMVHQRTEQLNIATREAQDGEAHISAVLETIVDGIFTINEDAVVESFNSAAERIFGYAAEDIIGANWSLLLAEPYRTMQDSYHRKFLKTGHISVLGRTQEVVGQRKDETTFPLEFAAGEMNIGGERKFTCIARDITDRKQAEKSKAEFISTVSHELRTPLTSIKGSLGLIRSNAAGKLPDKLKSMFDIAYSNSDRLVRLINDILDVEKISAGKMEYQIQPLNISHLLEQAVEAHQGYADENKIQFRLSLSTPKAEINGDGDRLMQVLANLMSNAAKFSPENDIVDISIETFQNHYRISISDNGPGIADEFREKIFERFSQADSSDTRQKGGTGLGLNITKSIVEFHGGTIDFKSEIGKGTTFFIDLPKLIEIPEGLPQTVVKHLPEDARILICEDEPDIATLLSKMLEQEGYQTDIARNASQASSLVQHHDYDAMTLDIGLPDRDGITLIRELRDAPKTRDLPILVVSAMAREGEKELNGEIFGVVDWLEKPIEKDLLAERLQRILSVSSDKPKYSSY